MRTRKDAGMGGQGFRPPLEASKDSAPSALSIRALPFLVRDEPAPPRGPGATSAKPSATKLDAILLTSSPVRRNYPGGWAARLARGGAFGTCPALARHA